MAMRALLPLLRAAAACAVALVLGACASGAHYPVNPPLAKYDPQAGYRIEKIAGDPGNSHSLLAIMMISGGGTRAAALAYGAFEALRDSPLVVAGKPTDLLSEVDTSSIKRVEGAAIHLS